MVCISKKHVYYHIFWCSTTAVLTTIYLLSSHLPSFLPSFLHLFPLASPTYLPSFLAPWALRTRLFGLKSASFAIWEQHDAQ